MELVSSLRKEVRSAHEQSEQVLKDKEDMVQANLRVCLASNRAAAADDDDDDDFVVAAAAVFFGCSNIDDDRMLISLLSQRRW